MAVLATIGAAGSSALSSIESSRIKSKDDQHPCGLIDDPAATPVVDCNLWFDLQVSVAALSVFSFLLSLILIIVISVALSKSKVFNNNNNNKKFINFLSLSNFFSRRKSNVQRRLSRRCNTFHRLLSLCRSSSKKKLKLKKKSNRK